MWLLRTDYPTMRYFTKPPPKYAILSHVWGDAEQTFQDVQSLSSHTTPPSGNRWVNVSSKIQECCAYADTHGYRWLWIDTCCIDKTSSAELSEAINSMYQWYASAGVCFAYLVDVPADEDPFSPMSSFRQSKWFTRGWTLQELLAPRQVHFLSKEWIWIGDKALFAGLLEQITGIDAEVLTFETTLFSVSVAERMRWASRRVTTRKEDEAYCLMGVFGVNLPIIYGEGKQAFRRLQEEIMRSSADHTLFAWGSCVAYSEYVIENWTSNISDGCSNVFADSPVRFSIPDNPHCRNIDACSLPQFSAAISPLLVSPSSPHAREILTGRDTRNVQENDLVKLDRVPELTLTSYGVRARLPIIEFPTGKHRTQISLALLVCRPAGTSLLIGLILRRFPGQAFYEVGFNAHCFGTSRCMTVDPQELSWRVPNVGESQVCAWRDIIIVQQNIALGPNAIPFRNPPNLPRRHSVCIPYHVVSRMRKQGFIPVATESVPVIAYHTVHSVVFSAGRLVITYYFSRPAFRDGFLVIVGSSPSHQPTNPHLCIKVKVRPSLSDEDSGLDLSSIVGNWDVVSSLDALRTVRSQGFGDHGRTVRLYVTELGTNRTDGGSHWSINIELAGTQFGEPPSPHPPPIEATNVSGHGTSSNGHMRATSVMSPLGGILPGSPPPPPYGLPPHYASE